MNLEPAVLHAIETRKKRVFMWKALIVVIVLIGVLAIAAMLISVLSTKTPPHAEPDNHKSLNRGLLTIVGLFLVFDLALLIAQAMGIPRARVRRRAELRTLTPAQSSQINRYRDGVEGASLALGLDPPEGAVLDIARTSYLLFEDDDGTPVIGMTPALLAADLTMEEAGSLMAQAVARLAVGDILSRRTGNPTGIAFLTCLECCGISLFILVLGIALRQGQGYQYSLPVLGLSAIVVFAASAGTLFLDRILAKVQLNSEVLADSIGVKITSDPASMEKLLFKLADDSLDGIASPRSIIGYAVDFDRGRPLEVQPPPMTLLNERILNLRHIEKGDWAVFERHYRPPRKSELAAPEGSDL